MPCGSEYPQGEKQLIFNVIGFVEKEKHGCVIPLYNVNERLDEERRKVEEEEEMKKTKEEELILRLRHRSSSRTERRFSPIARSVERKIPTAREPSKTTQSG